MLAALVAAIRVTRPRTDHERAISRAEREIDARRKNIATLRASHTKTSAGLARATARRAAAERRRDDALLADDDAAVREAEALVARMTGEESDARKAEAEAARSVTVAADGVTEAQRALAAAKTSAQRDALLEVADRDRLVADLDPLHEELGQLWARERELLIAMDARIEAANAAARELRDKHREVTGEYDGFVLLAPYLRARLDADPSAAPMTTIAGGFPPGVFPRVEMRNLTSVSEDDRSPAPAGAGVAYHRLREMVRWLERGEGFGACADPAAAREDLAVALDVATSFDDAMEVFRRMQAERQAERNRVAAATYKAPGGHGPDDVPLGGRPHRSNRGG